MKLNDYSKLVIELDNKIDNLKAKLNSTAILTDEVKDTVDKYSIDLIIMGTKGVTGAKEVLFGTNTIHVIKKSNCPVLAVPDGYFFGEPKEILFPTDYNVDYSVKQMQILKTITEIFDSKIHVINVSHGIDLSETQNTNKETLEKLFANIKHDSYRVDDQPIPQAINEFQKSTYVQLLMMINNKHSFFENLFFKPVINQIGFHLNIPFLVIPAKI